MFKSLILLYILIIQSFFNTSCITYPPRTTVVRFSLHNTCEVQCLELNKCLLSMDYCCYHHHDDLYYISPWLNIQCWTCIIRSHRHRRMERSSRWASCLEKEISPGIQKQFLVRLFSFYLDWWQYEYIDLLL